MASHDFNYFFLKTISCIKTVNCKHYCRPKIITIIINNNKLSNYVILCDVLLFIFCGSIFLPLLMHAVVSGVKNLSCGLKKKNTTVMIKYNLLSFVFHKC